MFLLYFTVSTLGDFQKYFDPQIFEQYCRGKSYSFTEWDNYRVTFL